MSPSSSILSSSTLTLTARRVSGQKPATHGGKQILIKYLSGAIHAKQHFTILPRQTLNFSAEFRAPIAKGTWPAFWLTGVKGWPPEIDLAEWKGSGKVSFNTFNTSSQVKARDITYEKAEEWHRILVEVGDVGNQKDVRVSFWMDGVMRERQWGRGFVGQELYLIINLQMEGSSGAPAPEKDTLFQARNVEVWRFSP